MPWRVGGGCWRRMVRGESLWGAALGREGRGRGREAAPTRHTTLVSTMTDIATLHFHYLHRAAPRSFHPSAPYPGTPLARAALPGGRDGSS